MVILAERLPVSTVEAVICECQTVQTPEIRLCSICHRYWLGSTRLTSVSKVISTVYPTDFSAVPPGVLETARLRGSFVDSYFSEWLRDPLSVIPLADVPMLVRSHFPGDGDKAADDTGARISRLIDWWMASGMTATAVQGIVYKEADKTAGTFDIATEDLILDLKNVSTLQPGYALQLGGYAHMDSQKFPLRDVGIIHVTKDKVKLVKYDTKKCKRQWVSAVSWFNTMQELGK